jgi:hypothetical protein
MFAHGPPIASGYRGSRQITTLEDFMDQLNVQTKTNLNIGKTRIIMVGPHVWQTI